MKNQPLVSIIIPVYNCEKYLPQCLDSILAAATVSMEIWLVNDGSTDGSEPICQDYAQKYAFIHTLTQKNAGPASARNAGFKKATGKYVAFFDSDDFIDPEIFQSAALCFAQGEADIWITNFQRVLPDQTRIPSVFPFFMTDKTPVAALPYMKDFVQTADCFWFIWRCWFKRAYLESLPLLFPEEYSYSEDMYFMVQALVHTEQIFFCTAPYYQYRVGDGASLTQSYHIKRLSQILAMLQLTLTSLEGKSALPYYREMKIRLLREYMMCFLWYDKIPAVQRAEARKQLSQSSKLMKSSPALMDRMFAIFVNFFGVRISVNILKVLNAVRKLCKKG